jgi:hypothetical protein
MNTEQAGLAEDREEKASWQQWGAFKKQTP